MLWAALRTLPLCGFAGYMAGGTLHVSTGLPILWGAVGATLVIWAFFVQYVVSTHTDYDR